MSHYISQTNKKRIVRYVLVTEHGKFFIRHGENRILKYYDHCSMVTKAGIDIGLILPEEIAPFDSFIKAVRFMKQNAGALR